MPQKILLICLISFISFSYASEIDNFTNRYKPLKDSAKVINQKTVQLFKESLDMANTPPELFGYFEDNFPSDFSSCNKQILYDKLRLHFKNHLFGKLTKFILKSPLVNRRPTNMKKSIYKDISFFESMVLAGPARFKKEVGGPIVRIGDSTVGADKFEHMFGRGWVYFRKFYKKNKTLEEVLKFGDRSERYMLGAKTTGVYSYGDMTANFNGMRFWNHVLNEHDDILGKKYNQGPYVKCIDDLWVMVKKIDWRNYIDDAFDESINCSKFDEDSMTKKVISRVKKLESRDREGRRYMCPVDPEKLDSMYQKYFPISKWIINTSGHDTLKDRE